MFSGWTEQEEEKLPSKGGNLEQDQVCRGGGQDVDTLTHMVPVLGTAK